VRLMSDKSQTTRIPSKDDQFLLANASRMFELLLAIREYHWLKQIPPETERHLHDFARDALADGIDIIGASECGLS
jgi:hypothetical protein